MTVSKDKSHTIDRNGLAYEMDELDTDTLRIGGTIVTATAAELNSVADVSARVETVAATNVITAAETGKTFILSDATEFASTLPAPATGLEFTFIIGAAPVGASYTIATNGGDNVIQGIAVVNGASVAAADEDLITFTASAAVVGDWVHVISDGTNWYVRGQAVAATGIAFTADA